MIYIAIALVAMTYLIVTRHITININHTHRAIEPNYQQVPEPTYTEDSEELHRDLPPSYDALVQACNEAIHDIGGSDER